MAVALSRSCDIGVKIRPRTGPRDPDVDPHVSRRGRVIHFHNKVIIVSLLTLIVKAVRNQQLVVVDDARIRRGHREVVMPHVRVIIPHAHGDLGGCVVVERDITRSLDGRRIIDAVDPNPQPSPR